MAQPALTLPSNRAFVVQFQAVEQGTPPRYRGRVEHLVSGQATHFHSRKELLAFMTSVLIQVRPQPSRGPGEDDA